MRTLLIVCLLGIALSLQGQQYDAQWALGYNESKLDFRNNDTVIADSLPTLEYFFLTNASICDSAGELLYYTNGISICGVNDTLLNGNNLSPSFYSSQDSLDGLNIPQAAIFLPMPGNSRYYYLFHFSNDFTDTVRPKTLYYSIIDKNGNMDKGAVTAKNIPLLQNTILREGGMTACKHANGRDYWLVVGEYNTNRFYEYLLTPTGIQGPFVQAIGPVFPRPYDVAYSKFSQDGSLYATGIYAYAPVLVMNFDRCSGTFSNPDTIFNNAATNAQPPNSGCAAVEISPNNRFLYVTSSETIWQYDLLQQNLHDSIIIYQAGSNDLYGVHMLQLSPNGKLYVSTWNGGVKALHVINYPDLSGDSCSFVYGGQPTFTISSVNLPNLINYRLGPLIGSGCDTLQTNIENVNAEDKLMRIQPNPADKYLYVEMGMQGNYEFDLMNVAGQVLDKRETPQVDYFDTEQLAAGNYFLRVIDKTTGKEVGAKEIEVVH